MITLKHVSEISGNENSFYEYITVLQVVTVVLLGRSGSFM